VRKPDIVKGNMEPTNPNDNEETDIGEQGRMTRYRMVGSEGCKISDTERLAGNILVVA
jgi:hypothetical protein